MPIIKVHKMALLLTTDGKLERTTKDAAFKRVGQFSLLPHPSIMAGRKMIYPREVYVSDESEEKNEPTNQWGIILAYMGYVCPTWDIWGNIAIPYRRLAKLEQFFKDSKDFVYYSEDNFDDKQIAAVIRLKWQDIMSKKVEKKEKNDDNDDYVESDISKKKKRKNSSAPKCPSLDDKSSKKQKKDSEVH
jgi:hypothetical protein